ncbi:hypothetical protein JXB12_06690 [candidate division KSB1 bacterium]|nr:hypothetical protein [candidate division KSB1 bacterium]
MDGDHGSKYRDDVSAPGRQGNPACRSANILVAPSIFFITIKQMCGFSEWFYT